MSYQTPEDMEQFEADMAPIWHQEYCERPIFWACDCGEVEIATEEVLERSGWQRKDGIEMCPNCAAYLGRRWQ